MLQTTLNFLVLTKFILKKKYFQYFDDLFITKLQDAASSTVRESKSVSSREDRNAVQQVIRAFQNSATLPPEIFFGTASSFTTAGSTTTTSTTAPPASTQERNIQLIQFSTPGSGSPGAARQKIDNSAALNSPNDVFLNDLEENEEQEEFFNETASNRGTAAQPTTAGKSRQTDDADDIAEGFTLSYDVSGEENEEDRGGERRC